VKNKAYYKKEKKPIVKQRADMAVLGGSGKYINPIRNMEKKKKKNLLQRIFG